MTGWSGVNPTVRAYGEYAMNYFRQMTGVSPSITSGGRSHNQQVALYLARQDNPNPVNRPGDSAHEYGWAFDSVVPSGWRQTWRELLEAFGFRVVMEPTAIHAEVPNWRSLVGR